MIFFVCQKKKFELDFLFDNYVDILETEKKERNDLNLAISIENTKNFNSLFNFYEISIFAEDNEVDLNLFVVCLGELPDPNADAIMSKCNVCLEKAYVNPCAHCDKKVIT